MTRRRRSEAPYLSTTPGSPVDVSYSTSNHFTRCHHRLLLQPVHPLYCRGRRKRVAFVARSPYACGSVPSGNNENKLCLLSHGPLQCIVPQIILLVKEVLVLRQPSAQSMRRGTATFQLLGRPWFLPFQGRLTLHLSHFISIWSLNVSYTVIQF